MTTAARPDGRPAPPGRPSAVPGSPQRSDLLVEVESGLALTLGTAAAVGFAVALLRSGLASTSVGTFAGEIVMRGFLRRRIRAA
ncbi:MULTISPECIES: divalent metal cation transporter [Micromonospora]|uniref:Divalent metal cation transporter n=1 Tax=Micromonospora sp. HUAS YX12 TaxID=3156396 RepID=A0AAU7R9U5_9ACTN